MADTKPSVQDDPAQSRRFIDMAREANAEENPEAFDRLFKSITKPVPTSVSRSHPSAKPPSS